MNCSQYLIAPAKFGGWTVHLEGQRVGPFRSRVGAIRVAVAEALDARNSHRRVRVDVRDEEGTILMSRCFCEHAKWMSRKSQRSSNAASGVDPSHLRMLRTTIGRHVVVVRSRKRTVTLEDEFWKELLEEANRRHATVDDLVSEVAHNSDSVNLATALRLFVLALYYPYKV